MALYDIKKTLIQAYVDGSFALDTAYENRTFTKPASGPFAEVYILPNQPTVDTLGDAGRDLHTGILQINLNYPRNQGDGAILTKADAIRNYYEAGTRFSHEGQEVFIMSCGRSVGRLVDNHYQIVLTINWRAQTARG